MDPERPQHIKRLVALAAAAVVAVAAIGGITVAVWQARVERAKAVERANQVREAARGALSESRDQIAALPGSSGPRGQLVQDAVQNLDRLAREASGDRELMRELGDAYEQIAAVQGSSDPSGSGTAAAAEASQQKAVAIREELVRQTGSESDRVALAKAYTGLGTLYLSSGPPEKTVEHLQHAISIFESMLGPPTGEEVRALLATSYLTIGKAYGSPDAPNLGDTRTALAYMRGALKMQHALAAEFPANTEHQRGVAATHHALGRLYSAMSEREEELAQLADARAIYENLLAATPDDVAVQRALASLYTELGDSHARWAAAPDEPQATSYWQRAREAYTHALSLYERLKAAGQLSGTDATKPVELAAEIAKCDAALSL